MNREELIRRVAAVSSELWVGGSTIFPSVRLAQALLETGGALPSWNNAFGIKVGGGAPTPYWDGRFVNRKTWEVVDGQRVDNVPADWRAYDSVEDSVRDHELFLQQARYAPVRAAKTPRQQCDALYAAGYATDAPASVDGDPSYAEKLWSVISSRGLTRYDEEAERTKRDVLERLARLETAAAALDSRVSALEGRARSTGGVPAWARDAVDEAVAAGIVDTPEGGSYDFYRVLTVMRRKGLL